jgi:arylsulfatase A-like enzyme
MGFAHVELMLGTMTTEFPPLLPPAGQHFERWFAKRRDEALALWSTRLPPDSGHAQVWNSALPAAWHPTSWVADRAIAALRGRDPRRPFCLWASIADPHHPFDCPEPWASLHAAAMVERPLPESADAARPWWYRTAQEGTPELADAAMRDFRVSKSRMGGLSAAQTARMVSNYYGMIAFADHAVGRILTELESLGLDERTIVIFLSDHGDLLGDHGLTLKGPALLDGVLRVPFIVSGPGVAAGQTVTAPVSTIDLAPTLEEIAGVAEGAAQGMSLAALLSGSRAAERAVYTEWRLDERRFGRALDLRCVRTADAKLIVEAGSGAGELYDLASDPDEAVNRFDDPACRALRQRMEAALASRPGGIRTQFSDPVGMS